MGHCKGGPHMESSKQETKQMGYSPNEMGHSPNEMSREFKYMPLAEDMTGKRASSIVNAGARSRMSGQPQMGHSPAEMGHSPAEMEHSPLEIEDDGGRGKARKEYDIRKGILDPKTGKRTFKESKRKQEVFVTKMGKVLPVGSKAKQNKQIRTV